jgi:hypothetical protein
MDSEEQLPDVGGRGGGDHDRHERPHGRLAQDELRREEDASDRRVEGGGDAAGGAGRDQDHALAHGHGQEPAGRGADRRADLEDRALSSDRSAAADAERGGQGLDDSDAGADDAAVVIGGVHDLRDPAAFGLRRVGLHEERDEDRPGDGREQDERPPRRRRRVDIRVIDDREPSEEEQIMEDGDQRPEGHGAEPRGAADADRQNGQSGKPRGRKEPLEEQAFPPPLLNITEASRPVNAAGGTVSITGRHPSRARSAAVTDIRTDVKNLASLARRPERRGQGLRVFSPGCGTRGP